MGEQERNCCAPVANGLTQDIKQKSPVSDRAF